MPDRELSDAANVRSVPLAGTVGHRLRHQADVRRQNETRPAAGCESTPTAQSSRSRRHQPLRGGFRGTPSWRAPVQDIFKVTSQELRQRASAGGRKPQTLLRSGASSCPGPAQINRQREEVKLSLEVTWQPVGTIGWLSRDALNWMRHIARSAIRERHP